MAKQSKAEIQATWEDRINRALAHREDDFDKPFRVKMAREYLDGKQRPSDVPDHEWITVNKLYSHMQAQLPILYSLDPYYYIKVKRSYSPDPNQIAAFEERGKIRQAYLNYLKKELDLKAKARLSIQDAHTSFGVVKVHYCADEYDNEDAGKPILDEDGLPMIGDDGLPLMEPETIPVNERYVVSRIHPDDLLFSEDAGTLPDKWHWIAERVRMTPAEARRRKLISKAVLDETPTSNRDKENEETSSFFGKMRSKMGGGTVGEKDDRQVYIGWEIYDLDNKEWLMILEGGKKPAIEPQPLPPGIDTHPYAVLRFTLRDDSPYPNPPLSQALDPQREFNLARSKVLTHRKRFNRKYEVFTGGLESELELDKLENGDDGTIIRKNGPVQCVFPISDAQLDPQNYTEIAALNSDMVELLGTPGEARGLATADSATQAAIIDKRLEVREGDRVSIVSDWLGEIGEKLDQLVQAHITAEEAIKVAGPRGEAWQLIKPADFEAIDGEFEYSVDVGSTQPRLPQIERAQWMAFMQVLAGFPHLMTSERFMKHMAEMHNISDETMVEELRQIGLKIMQGQQPMPGQSGSKPGVADNNPITALLGAAMGAGGGTVNGGGAPTVQQ